MRLTLTNRVDLQHTSGRHGSNSSLIFDRLEGTCTTIFILATMFLHRHAARLTHWRQEPFLVTRKTYTKPSTFVKYAIRFVSGANLIANSKFAEQYVKNNKANQIF